jgi:ubiquinone/menaquinone biosynthesis C-methylase UbiE
MAESHSSVSDVGRSPFPETADIETSTDRYATRFAGATGEWMLAVQERITLGFLRDTGARSVLDVGGGHGQLALPIVREGYEPTVLGSAPECVRRIADAVAAGRCRFVVGNVLALPFPDRAFDCAISFRLLTHCSDWPALIAELCRVSRHTVIVDYPTSTSLNVIAPMLFETKQRIESNVRHWTLFRHAQVTDAFARNGFRRDRKTNQFFLPMVLHRAMKRRAASVALEAACRATGLTALAGSPTIVRMRRAASSS